MEALDVWKGALGVTKSLLCRSHATRPNWDGAGGEEVAIVL